MTARTRQKQLGIILKAGNVKGGFGGEGLTDPALADDFGNAVEIRPPVVMPNIFEGQSVFRIMCKPLR